MHQLLLLQVAPFFLSNHYLYEFAEFSLYVIIVIQGDSSHVVCFKFILST